MSSCLIVTTKVDRLGTAAKGRVPSNVAVTGDGSGRAMACLNQARTLTRIVNQWQWVTARPQAHGFPF
jgi:hypothetical protein